MVSTRKNKVRLSIGIGGIKMTSPSKKRPGKKKNAAGLLNCHPCRTRQEVALTCLNCELSFCGRVLKDQYQLVKDPVTGWPCPRCTGVCNCKKCNALYAKVKKYPFTRIAESSGASSNSIASDAGKSRFEDEEGEGEGEDEEEEAGFEDLSNQESGGVRLVDRLRTEVTRLEAELVNEKLKNEEMEIEMSQLKLKNEEMEIEMSQLKRERDLALELVYIRRKSLKG